MSTNPYKKTWQCLEVHNISFMDKSKNTVKTRHGYKNDGLSLLLWSGGCVVGNPLLSVFGRCALLLSLSAGDEFNTMMF